MKLKKPLNNSLKMPVNRGFAVVLILLGLMIVGGIVVLKTLNAKGGDLARQQVDTDVLARAKLALLANALNDSSVGWRPGNMLIPDFPSNATGGYNGIAAGGCQDVTQPNGFPLIAGTSTSLGANMRCVGRLPWKGLDLDISLNKDFSSNANQHDPLGEAPWYAVSANLVDSCFGKLNAETLMATAPLQAQLPAVGCSNTNPVHPWLTVHDATGKIISSQVAAVAILPGIAVAGQNRTPYPALGNATQYLDSLSVNDAVGCASMLGAPSPPCVINNAGLSNHFIMGNASSTFNDRLLYITVQELTEQLQKRMATEIRSALNDYAAKPQNVGKYPWLIPVAGSVATPTTIQGRVPHMSAAENLPSEFTWNVISGGTETTAKCVQVEPTTWVPNPLRNTFELPIANPSINFRNGSSGSLGTCRWKNGALSKTITNISCNYDSAAAPVSSIASTYATKSDCETPASATGSTTLQILRTASIKIAIDVSSSGECIPANFSVQISAANSSDVARLKSICTSGSVVGMVTISDKYQSLLAPIVKLDSKGTGANFEIGNMRISPVMPSWFGENGWHTQSFMSYAAANAPVAVVNPCSSGISVGSLINVKAAIVIAGAPTSAQASTRPSTNLADYFDGLQGSGTGCNFSASNTPHTTTYNDTVMPITP